MRKFLITSPNFSGNTELVYGEQDSLVYVSFLNATMTGSQKQSFLHSVPMQVSLIEPFSAKYPQLTVVETSFTITFDAFWDKYNKKINRIRASNLWQKLSAVEQVKAYYGIVKYEKYLKKEGWRGKADPETYLRNKYWENEY